MHIEQPDDQLIELGPASVETRGGDWGVLEAMQTLMRPTGLSAD